MVKIAQRITFLANISKIQTIVLAKMQIILQKAINAAQKDRR